MISPHYTVEETRTELLRIAEEYFRKLWDKNGLSSECWMGPWLQDLERCKIREISERANAALSINGKCGEEPQQKNV